MKQLFALISFVAFCNMCVYAQSNWTTQTFGTNSLRNINFTNSDTGYIVGDSGLILTTTNSSGPFIKACYNSMSVLNPTGGKWIWGKNISIGDTISFPLAGNINNYDVPWCTSYSCCDNLSYDGMSISLHTIKADTSYRVYITGGLSGGAYSSDGFVEIPSGWIIDSIIDKSNVTGLGAYHIEVKNKIIFQTGTDYGGCVCSDCGRANLNYFISKNNKITITPNSGGNIGDVTVNIYGSGFGAGTSVKLTKVGQPDIIVPDSMLVVIDEFQIKATLDLQNKLIGYWDVNVTFPDSNVITLPNGFKIDSGIVADPWSQIIGFNTIRTNQWQTYTIVYGNNGNVDAWGVPLWLAVPKDAQVQFDFDISIPNDTTIDFDTIPLFVLADSINGEAYPDSMKVFGFTVANVPSNSTSTFSFKIKVSTINNFKLITWANQPIYTSSDLKESFKECLFNITQEVMGENLPENPVMECLENLAEIWNQPLQDPNYGSKESMSNYYWNILRYVNNCILPLFPGSKILTVTKEILEKIFEIKDKYETYNPCFQVLKSLIFNKNISVVASFDPNDKIGPSGMTGTNYYNTKNPFNYVIHFENDSSATAWAQNVLIVDTLDKNVFDLNTLVFGDISFGDKIVNVPPGKRTFTTFIDLQPNNNIIVKIDAKINDTTGVLTWNYTSLDLISMRPVTDPMAGFLPPNVNPTDGEGSVFYTIKPKNNLVNNTVINNKAYIYFDQNPPMQTSVWSNVLDNIKPHSAVNQLLATQTDTSFVVSWSGTDTSSGIWNYSIYYSVNNNNYIPWIINTTNTSSIFKGEIDSIYYFYSIATDSAGNVESTPLDYDAKTTIITNDTKTIFINDFHLKIYPNPSNSSSTIEYTLFQDTEVNIVVYNTFGKIVSVLATGQKEKGIHKNIFDGLNLSSGIYFCKFSIGGKSAVSKITLIK